VLSDSGIGDAKRAAGGRKVEGLAGLQQAGGIAQRVVGTSGRIGEVGPVEEIVKLRAELEIDALGDGELLLRRELELAEVELMVWSRRMEPKSSSMPRLAFNEAMERSGLVDGC
jgi:hypothetical protein